MYNGIGLTTPRGSGTNGYVQRNLSVLRTHETAAERAAAWDVAPPKHREPDEAILEHERKRKVEVKCLELQLKLEDDGLEETDIEVKVAALREELLANLASLATSAKNLKSSDTHAIAAAKKTELDKMARALGTRRDYAEGEAFDREKQEENKRMRLVEREERDKKREEERARMQEQRQRWETEKRERERLRRREEDRMRREREADELKRRERMPPPPVPPYRERAGRDSYRRAFSPRRREAAYERRRSRSRSQSRSRSPDPARRRRPRSPVYSRRRTPPPRRALERSISPPRRRSHSPSPRRDRGRYDSPPPHRGRDRSESPVRDDRSPPPRSDDSREERRERELSVSPKPSRGHARSRSGSAGSSMSVSTNDSRSSGRSD